MSTQNKEVKMEKILYQEPELEIIDFEAEDVITTSTPEPYPGEDDPLY